jgi:hypothetical protein
MRTYGCLLVGMLCSGARVAAAQLTARDTAVLVDAIAERIRAQFGTGVAREPFVIVTHNQLASPGVHFAMRVSAAIHARDSSLIVAEPTRSTPRITLGALDLVAGDTATLTLWVGRCKGTPVIYTGNNASLAFRRVGDHWAFVERNVGGSGTANNGCPW